MSFSHARILVVLLVVVPLLLSIVVWTAIGQRQPNVQPGEQSLQLGDSASSYNVKTHWHLGTIKLEIGQAIGDPRYEFGRVVGAVRLPNGNIAVADGRNLRIGLYNKDGRFIRAGGRRGSGPGEFQHIGQLLLCSDSLYAYDQHLSMISVFDTAGAFSRSFDPAPALGHTISEFQCGNGNLLVLTSYLSIPRDQRMSPFRASALIAILSSDGERLAELGRVPASESYRLAHRSIRPRPLGDLTLLAAGPEFFYVGDTAEDSVRQYAWASRSNLHTGLPVPWQRLRVTPQVMEALIASETAPYETHNAKREVERHLNELRYPEDAPAYDMLLADTFGRLFVRRFDADHRRARLWIVFEGATGSPIADLTTPAGFRPTQILDWAVLGVYTDTQGVHYIRIYQIEEGTA